MNNQTIIIQPDVELLAKEIKAGKVVAFPTDTVYGLACISNNEEAILRLKQLKGRSETKPLPMMVADVKQLQNIAQVNVIEQKLFDTFTPGAITLVLTKHPTLPQYVNNGFDTIAVRIPDDAFILALIKKVGVPLLVTSANRSDLPTGTTMAEVLNQIPNGIDYIVAGECIKKVASTIVDARDTLQILRVGAISTEMIKEAIK